MKIYNFLWAFAATPGPCCHIMLPFLCCALLACFVLFRFVCSAGFLLYIFGTNLLMPFPPDLLRYFRIGEICAIFYDSGFARIIYILIFYSFTICRPSAAIKVAFTMIFPIELYDICEVK